VRTYHSSGMTLPRMDADLRASVDETRRVIGRRITAGVPILHPRSSPPIQAHMPALTAQPQRDDGPPS
jgi:hypothetical protein